jgi:nitrogen-specific signal transduction histidine kinase
VQPEPLSGGGRHILREADLSAEAARVLADLAPDERGRVAESLAAGLPAVLIDSNAIGQAIGNVLRNAFEAGDSVQLRTRLEEDYVPAASTTVRPRGPLSRHRGGGRRASCPGGRGRLFEPFVNTKFAGRGLGLAATAGIMGSQHGFVEVSSTTEGCRVPCFASP